MKCNQCARSFEDDERYESFHNPLLHKFTVTFGYGSKLDGSEMVFWKCENCLIEEVGEFNVLPQIKDYCLMDYIQ